MAITSPLNPKRPSFKDANNIAAAINACFGGIAHRAEFHQRYRARPPAPGAGGIYVATGRCAGAGGKIRARVVRNFRVPARW